MKHVPNIMSLSRIILSAALLFIKPFEALFYIVYIICGVSDMLDGFIARKTKNTSKLGALLDSIGDFVFCAVMVYIILTSFVIPTAIIIWIIGIALVRIISLIIGYNKFRKAAFLHTYLNKLTGIILFCVPIFYKVIDLNVLFIVPSIAASVSAIEDMIINIKAKELNRDVKGLFIK